LPRILAKPDAHPFAVLHGAIEQQSLDVAGLARWRTMSSTQKPPLRSRPSLMPTVQSGRIDPETGFPIPERAGVLRYYVRVEDKIEWADRPEDFMQHLPGIEALPPGFDSPRPISVTFIPASVFDNPALLQVNPEYVSWLRSLPLLECERLAPSRREFEKAFVNGRINHRLEARAVSGSLPCTRPSKSPVCWKPK